MFSFRITVPSALNVFRIWSLMTIFFTLKSVFVTFKPFGNFLSLSLSFTLDFSDFRNFLCFGMMMLLVHPEECVCACIVYFRMVFNFFFTTLWHLWCILVSIGALIPSRARYMLNMLNFNTFCLPLFRFIFFLIISGHMNTEKLIRFERLWPCDYNVPFITAAHVFTELNEVGTFENEITYKV